MFNTYSKEAVQTKLDTLWAGAAVIIASLHFISYNLQHVAVKELTQDLHGVREEYEIRAFSWILSSAFLDILTI
jgi:hypothetical protein